MLSSFDSQRGSVKNVRFAAAASGIDLKTHPCKGSQDSPLLVMLVGVAAINNKTCREIVIAETAVRF